MKILVTWFATKTMLETNHVMGLLKVAYGFNFIEVYQSIATFCFVQKIITIFWNVAENEKNTVYFLKL